MFTTILYPDFKKLISYFPTITPDQIKDLPEKIDAHFEHIDEVEFDEISSKLVKLCEKYGIQDHFNELLYLTLKKTEEICEIYNVYWQNYEEIMRLKQTAQFLIGMKNLENGETLELNIKPSRSKTINIKDTGIAKWMAETIYEAIEKEEYPLGIFGVSVQYHLFSDQISGEPLSNERLERVAKLKLSNPKLKLKKLTFDLCSYLQKYLIEQTNLTLKPNTSLSDQQANFFFEVLVMLNFIDDEKIASEPKDYIYAMFAYYNK